MDDGMFNWGPAPRSGISSTITEITVLIAAVLRDKSLNVGIDNQATVSKLNQLVHAAKGD